MSFTSKISGMHETVHQPHRILGSCWLGWAAGGGLTAVKVFRQSASVCFFSSSTESVAMGEMWERSFMSLVLTWMAPAPASCMQNLSSEHHLNEKMKYARLHHQKPLRTVAIAVAVVVAGASFLYSYHRNEPTRSLELDAFSNDDDLGFHLHSFLMSASGDYWVDRAWLEFLSLENLSIFTRP